MFSNCKYLYVNLVFSQSKLLCWVQWREDNFVLLVSYAGWIRNYLPAFRDKFSVLEQKSCSETSVVHYQSTLRNIPEEQRSHTEAEAWIEHSECKFRLKNCTVFFFSVLHLIFHLKNYIRFMTFFVECMSLKSVTTINYANTMVLVSLTRYMYSSLTKKCIYINLKTHIKIYVKIHINIASTCFGLRPSSGSLHWTWSKLYLC